MDLQTLQKYWKNPNLKYKDVLDQLILICETRDIQVTVTESLKGGLCAGGGAFIGGMLGGPIGIAVGGAFGSAFGAAVVQNFRPLVKIIREDFTDKERRELTETFIKLLVKLTQGGISLTSGSLLNSNSKAAADILVFIKDYFSNNHNMNIRYK